jgi:drug/metabolite transporter (DMT)-like permease
LFTAINGAIFSVVGRSVRKGFPRELLLALAMVGASVIMLPLWKESMIHSYRTISYLSWFNTIYLAFIMYAGSVLWYKALGVLDAVEVTIYLNVTTILAITWGILFFQERINILYFLGAALILGAIFLVNTSSRGKS